jgi:TolB-like protein
MDKEISALAEKLAAQVKESGRKKVTILDFTDLQGNSSELGRFLAEELSVGLVERRSGFSVMDRANLKTILAEHKLTVDGLVEPENAKKLGQFSGVDAIVLGKVTPLKDEVAITVKVIATDTAETLGAARGRIPNGKEIEHLLGSALGIPRNTQTNTSTDTKPADQTRPSPPSQSSKTFGNLSVTLDRLQSVNSVSGVIQIVTHLDFHNKSDKNSVAVALYCVDFGSDVRSTLLASDGTELQCESFTGIRMMNANPKGLTEIEPGGTIKVSIIFKTYQSMSDAVNSFRLQSELVVNPDYSDATYPSNYQPRPDVLPRGCKIHNLVLDTPVTRRK